MALSLRLRRPAGKQQIASKRNFSTSRSSRNLSSPRIPLPGVPNNTGDAGPLPTGVSVAKASNGVTVVTYDTPVPVTSVSLFINAGSRFENPKNFGVSHFLGRYAWKNSIRKNALQLVRDNEVRGNTMATKHTRENIVVTVQGARNPEFQQKLVETLGCVAEPLIEEYAVDRLREQIAMDVAKYAQCGFTTLTEALHSEAFRDQQLGNPLWTPEWNIDHVSDTALRTFTNTYYTRDRMTVVAVGMEPNVALELVEKELTPLPLEAYITENMGPQYVDVILEALKIKEPIVTPVAPKFVGGGEHRTVNNGNTKIAIALPGVGANQGIHAELVAGTLQAVLGGGEQGSYQFTPGAGRQSRLGANVVGKMDYVLKARAFNFTYSDGGLFGVYVDAKRGNAGKVFDALRKELDGLSNITDAEVARARSQLKLKLAATLNGSREALAEFFIQQLQGGNKTLLTPEQYIAMVDKVTTADVVNFAKQALSSKPTVACAGDVAGITKL